VRSKLVAARLRACEEVICEREKQENIKKQGEEMRLYEFEAKNIFATCGIPIPQGKIITTPKEAKKVAEEIGKEVALKAQVLVTGRGKLGGVKFASSPEKAESTASKMLKARIKGYSVEQILIEEKLVIEQELYLGATYDEVAKKRIMICSSMGGMDINEVSQKHPEKIFKVLIDPFIGFQPYQAKELSYTLGLPPKMSKTIQSIILNVWKIFIKFDATLTEINPLGLTKEGKLIVCDAHIEIEDDALFRQKKRLEKFGINEREDKARPPTEFEIKAAEIDRADYRGVAGRVTEFGGNLGLLIGAGGGSLTTFDAVLNHGGKPANYCEVGGNAPVRKIYNLTKLILTKQNVKGLAVITNVYSNSRVDFIARGVIKAMVESGIDPKRYPILFRSAGAFEKDGYAILKKYGVEYYGRETPMDEAARLAVEMMKKRE